MNEKALKTTVHPHHSGTASRKKAVFSKLNAGIPRLISPDTAKTIPSAHSDKP
jgi:hypothetical protein